MVTIKETMKEQKDLVDNTERLGESEQWISEMEDMHEGMGKT